MATATLGSLLLSSTNPARLRDFYATAFEVKSDKTPGDGPGYDVLDFGGFYVFIDSRDDVATATRSPDASSSTSTSTMPAARSSASTNRA